MNLSTGIVISLEQSFTSQTCYFIFCIMTVIFAAGHEAVSGKLMISSIPRTKDTFKLEVWWKRQSTVCKEKKNSTWKLSIKNWKDKKI